MYELLIIDDVAENLRVLQSILQRKDFRIRAATSAQVALKLIAKKVPDLIISDVQMPDISGIDLCQQLAQDDNYKSIPVILVSAFDDEESVELAMASHCKDFFLKPYNPQEVLARIRVQLMRVEQQKRTLRQEVNSAVNQLVDGVANEISTPLGTSILTSTHMKETILHFEQLYQKQQVTSSKLKDFILFCHDSVDLNLSNLNRVADMMEMFRAISASDRERVLEDVNLISAIEKVIAHYHAKLSHMGVVVKLDGPSVTIHTDGYLLQIVLGNLIGNSLSHAYIDDSAMPIEIKWQQKEDIISICFCDHGRGVESEQLEQVLKPFYTTKRGRAGHVGLSATVAANIIMGPLHGEVDLVSDERGLVWQFSFPMKLDDL
ncbi:hybrid sensor histidine kinase/response regulator [Vibrio tapetis subsp. quintayensis]|uniref:hybrid sensor histidine kinase/response regulator n=1 Tax=Vibrio tapetis TaxID=52443 RepID=UPI0025B59023|nr:hybrid sensor histidine kinase/response regulator [Vibrio tapetis]MDN3681922.1 hybrid sensor histidine kinase/response regulator [Vibrio tapetis subsp. quintayensis]